MADPFTMAAIGATAGALTNKDDPLKGAVLGGALGYGGASAMGAMPSAANYAALPGLEAAGAGSQAAMLAEQTAAFGLPGMTATGQGLATATNPALSSAFGLANRAMLPAAEAAAAEGSKFGMKEYMGLNLAKGLLGGQDQPQGGVAMAPMQRGQYQPVMTPQSLLATQMDMRRRQPFSFA